MKVATREVPVLRTLTRNALRRTWGSAVVLVLFVALSAMLASSAGALVTTVSGATTSFMGQARTPHFLQMHAGALDEQRLTEFAADNDLVEEFAVSSMLNVDGAAIRVTGPATDATLASGLQDNSFVTQNADFDFLLDTRNQVIEPEPGTVWLPLYYQDLLGLEVGQTLTVSGPGAKVALTIAGFLRDSQMNSSYASSKRLLVAPVDKAALAAAVGETGRTEHLIQFRLSAPAVVGDFEAQYRAAGLEANGPTITWSLFVLVNSLSEGITAAIVILVTLLLVGIALLCIKFTLLTTIEQDYREIGVLKAIGLRNRDLKRLYSRRYLVLASAGAVLGLIASLGLSRLLLRRVELFMGPSERTLLALLSGVALSGLVVVIVILAVRRTLNRIERVSPVQAIRSGPANASPKPGSRPPPRPSLIADNPGVNVRLGLRDLRRRRGLYAVPLVIFTLASFILVVPQNLYSTVIRPDFITYLGAGVSDMRFDVQAPVDRERLTTLSDELTGDPRVTEFAVLATASYTAVDADGTKVLVKLESGDLATFPLSYLKGAAPTSDDQVALSTIQADALDAGLGDMIAVSPVAPAGGTAGPLELTVSGIYQDVTNGGMSAKMIADHTSTDLMWSTVYADFEPGLAMNSVIAEYAAANPDLKVSSVHEYLLATLGGTIAALRNASLAAFFVGLAVAAMITALFMPLLIARDAFSIAVMKALGFRFRHIQRQYVVRSLVVLIAGVALGAVLANTLGGGLAGLFLSGVGLSRLQLAANGWLVYLASPLSLLAVVAATTLISTRPGIRFSISSTLKE